MSYKVTISDGTVLQECIENVTFNVDAPKDYNSWNTNVRKSIRITGKIDTDESTISLYNWALLPATNKDCYKEITVEEYRKNILVRKVHFSKAFVAQYSENYSNSNGVGTFTLYVKQLFNNEIEVTDKETASNSSAADTPSNTPEEPVQEVKKEAVVSTVLPFKKKHQKITDKLAKGNKMPDNNITVVEYGEHFTKDGRKKVLKPNVQYTTPEGYTYRTDKLGRIISCEGTLKKGLGKRKPYAQKTVGGKDRKPDDDGGHLIASIFKGSGHIDNLVPMNANLNKGEWKKLENDWLEALNAQPPEEVKVKIKPIYDGDSKRPSKFIVKYKIGNSRTETRELYNRPGGK